MPEVVRVFLSSTWEDLQSERSAVEEVLHAFQDADFNGMEYFGSRPGTPREESLNEVDRSHLYIGIFGRRYGSGITEDEYRRARERGLPCLIYALDAAVLTEAGTTGEEATKVSRRDALRSEFRRFHIATYFRSPDALATKVAIDLHRELTVLRRPPPMWWTETGHPVFSIDSSGTGSRPDGIAPNSWRIQHLGGDPVPWIERRFRGRTFVRDWWQTEFSALPRAHVTDELPLGGPETDDPRLPAGTIGLEIRFDWHGTRCHELHVWPVARRTSDSNYELGREGSIQYWTEQVAAD